MGIPPTGGLGLFNLCRAAVEFWEDDHTTADLECCAWVKPRVTLISVVPP